MNALNKPDGKNGFCGPVAVAAIAGITTDAVAQMIRARRRSTGPVKGTYMHEILGVLKDLGYEVTEHYSKFRLKKGEVGYRLDYFVEREGAPNRTMLVMLTDHWLVVQGQNVLCAQQHRELLPCREAKRAKARVVTAWRIEPVQKNVRQKC